MAAVISGNGLGLFNSSLNQLGFGLGGSARLGQGQNDQYVNVKNGNLVLHSQDEQLLFRGMSLGQFRTYNSRGSSVDAGADGWLTGFERRVELVSGTLNAAGSVMRLHTGDGSFQDFAYSATNTYTSTTGDGAHDTLNWTAGAKTWTYLEGTTRRQELYADHANAVLKGRITRITDLKSDGAAPVAWDVLYDGNGRISQVRSRDTSAGGNPDGLTFGYDSNGRLVSLSTRENGVTREQVTYGYDAAGRLSTVLVDLTPQDGAGDRDNWDAAVAANNDGYLFRTTYTYVDATSLQIASVRNGDGTVVSYTYDAQGRVATVTDGDTNTNDADGAGHTIAFVYDDANLTTHLTDAAGRTWSYRYDAAGQLLEVRAPALDGQRTATSYTYDAAGNLVRQQTVRGAVVLAQTDTTYDSNGNALWEWRTVDASAGATAVAVSRTYNAANQLVSETRYTGLDADGAGNGQSPSGGLTTRYVYDTENRVRFIVDPAGDVQEIEYAASGNGIGQAVAQRSYLAQGYSGPFSLSDLMDWASPAKKAASTLVEYRYDLKGRLAQSRQYASVDGQGVGIEDDAAAICNYVYDAQGLLRQKTEMRSSTIAVGDGRDSRQTTAYAYDGMGRLLSEIVTDQVGNGAATRLRTATWSYQDSGNRLRTIIENGLANDGVANDLLRIEARNAAGETVAVTESAIDGSAARVSRHYYDTSGLLRASEDATGARQYFFYDAQGRLVGQVDEVGAVTTLVLDGMGRTIQTAALATRVDTSGWLVAGKVVPENIAAVSPAASADDRTAQLDYDDLGRLVSRVDGEGGITTYQYDGAGRLLQSRTTDALATASTARVMRMFYDDAGRQTGMLDAEGYLTEYRYDRGGRRIQQIAYATATSAAARAAGTLTDLRPASASQDQSTRYFYDGRNNLLAELDAEGYLTEYVYDQARNQRALRAYARRLSGLTGNESLSTLHAQAETGGVRETRRQYDALGRLTTELAYNGLATRYTYDAQGRLLKTEAAYDHADLARETNRRYDVFGNLVGELDGEASALLPGLTPAQVDALYATRGTRHVYDALNRRTESIDAEGNKTWYFYDAAGQQTYLVRGIADAAGVLNATGEVVETRYTAFGQVRDTTAYTGRIVIGAPGDRNSVASAITVLAYASSTDSRTQYGYDRRGLVASAIDAGGALTTFVHDAFGDTREIVQQTGPGASTRTVNVYDKRGLLRSQTQDADVLARAVTREYDAFGRTVAFTDGNGYRSVFEFDRLGRQVGQGLSVSGRYEHAVATYDAYDRVLTQTDAGGRITTYAYDDAQNTFVVTTPEGVTVRTNANLFGQTVSVTDALGNLQSYDYDRDGLLIGERDAEGAERHTERDARGLVHRTIDETGHVVAFTYDAAGRVLTRTQDPAGLNLTATYRYDAQGRQISVTDPGQRRTDMRYDANGRLREMIQDPEGLALRTTYDWDARGLQLRVVEGAGTPDARTVAYAYDGLGRRTSETLAPATLALTTTYAYDRNDNLTSKVDAEGRVNRYTYDEADRLIFAVDGAGGVVRKTYDIAGRLVATRAYANRIGTAGLAHDVATQAIASRLQADDAHDVREYRVYDRDGRLAYSIDGAGAVQTNRYDAAGRLFESIRYANAVDLDTALVADLTAGTAERSELATIVQAEEGRDAVTWFVRDRLGRVSFSIDGAGRVSKTAYDAAGRVQVETRYLREVYLDATFYSPALGNTVTLREYLSAAPAEHDFHEPYPIASVLSSSSLQETGYVYDRAGRVAYELTRTTIQEYYSTNPSRVMVHGYTYDASGLVVESIDYGRTIELSYYGGGYYGGYGEGGYYGGSYYGESGLNYTTPEQVAAALTNSYGGPLASVPQRKARFVYDQAGRKRFEIDPAGGLSEMRYNHAGDMVETRTYGTLYQGARTEAAITAAVAQSQDYRSSTLQYDDAGRLHVRTDAYQHQETYGYDGTGLLVSYTNRDNHTWTYGYDAAGRRTRETSPQVAVSGVDANGQLGVVNRAIVTESAYDGLGNVVARTEDAGTPGARVTEYAYDNRGHQIRVTFPDAGRLDGNGNLVATGVRATTEVTYDTLGRAVAQKDVLGNVTYRIYDVTGMLVYDMDALGYVTGYEYDGWGNQTQLRRFYNRPQSGGGEPGGEDSGSLVAGGDALMQLEPGQVLSEQEMLERLVYSGSDRIINTTYDNVGRKQVVTDDNGGQTRFAYNAYGELALETTKLDDDYATQYDYLGYGDWASTFHYYDAAGRKTLTIAPEGYVTTWSYTAQGEVREQVEYARAIEKDRSEILENPPVLPNPGDAASGYDRVTRWQYDALGRKASETNVRHIQNVGGSTTTAELVTAIGYDNEGHARTVTVDGQTTTTHFDALGRAVSVQESERAVVRGDAASQLQASPARRLEDAALYAQVSPYSTMAYDAFGGVVQVRQYANGLRTGDSAPVASAADAVHSSRYDWQGRNVWEKDAAGTVYTKTYDAADRLLDSRYRLDGNDGRWAQIRAVYTYDDSGRQLTSKVTRETFNGATSAGVSTDTSERVAYNAFGEIIAKDSRLDPGLSDSELAAQFRYDRSGNMIASNAEGGIWHEYGYDLAGRQVAESHQTRIEQDGLPALVTVETRSELDLAGRVIRTILPSYNDDLSTDAVIERRYDRWGNVLQMTDARGGRTDYRYNETNQVVREVGAAVKVVAENGTESIQRPVSEWFYDLQGRLLASKDANNKTRYNHYDDAGRLQYGRDATDGVTRVAYDAMGRQVLTQNALGSVSFQDYDRAGRVVAQGDYLLNPAGTARARTVREQYQLDQNGDRLVVTDALNQSAKYDYDSRGKLLRSQTAAGVVMTYAYDSNGNKIRETNALVSATPISQGGILTPIPLLNPSFEPGELTVWSLGPGWSIQVADGDGFDGHPQTGVGSAEFARFIGSGDILYGGVYPLSAGVGMGGSVNLRLPITASVQVRQGSAAAGEAAAAVMLVWYDENFQVIGRSLGNTVDSSDGGEWQLSTVTADPPPGAYAVGVGAQAARAVYDGALNLDNFQWDLAYNFSSEGEEVYLNEQTWGYDYFNRVVDHNDLSGVDYDYDYDPESGQLVSQRNDWVTRGSYIDTSGFPNAPYLPVENFANGTREYAYYANGQVKEIREQTSEGTNWTRYSYDASGNRTREETSTVDGLGDLQHLRTTTAYDSHNRIVLVQQDDVAQDRRVLEVHYAYDAVGNRRRVDAGTSYNPNGTPPPNAGFEDGDTGWELGAGWSIVEESDGNDANTGQWGARFDGTGPSSITNNVRIPVQAGEVVSGSVMVQQGASDSGDASARVLILWYDANGNPLPGGEGKSWAGGRLISSGSHGEWKKSDVTTKVPVGAAFMSIAASARKDSGSPLFVDDFAWSYKPVTIDGGNGDPNAPANLDLQSGSAGWTLNGIQIGSYYGDGNNVGIFSYNGGNPGAMVMQDRIAVQGGENFSASVKIRIPNRVDQVGGGLRVLWLDADGNYIDSVGGNEVNAYWGGGYPNWGASTINVKVPANAAYAQLQGEAFALRNGTVLFDDFSYTTANDDELRLTQSYWYAYDGENRVTVANGKLENGEIVLGNTDASFALGYDAAGNAVSRLFKDGGIVMNEQTEYDQRDRRVRVFQGQALGSTASAPLAEAYEYDELGRQVAHRIYDDAGALKHLDRVAYDADGRMLSQTSYGRSLDGHGYDGTPAAEGLALVSRVDYSDAAGYGYDAAGRLKGYSYQSVRNEQGTGATEDTPSGFTHSYRYQYEGRDSYLETRVYGSSTNGNFKASTSDSSYDAWGRRIAIRENTPGQRTVDDRLRYFSYDAEGSILLRREGTLEDGLTFTQDDAAVGQTQLYAYVGGQQVASGKYNGELDIIGRLTAYDTSEIGTVRITVQAGDTLRSIAQRVYGNANLWYVLAEANAMTDGDLVEGVSLTVPDVKVSANDATTFRPYNPAEAIGDTSPTLPYIMPPPKQHCKALSQLISVVVTIVVTYYAGAAAGAAAGNLAYQGTQLMFNGQYDWGRLLKFTANPFAGNSGDFARTIYDPLGNGAPGKIDYEQVGIAAAAGYAGSAAGAAVSSAYTGAASAVLSAATSAAVSYSTSYALNRAAGNDPSFSLRQLGASAASAAAGQAISGALGAGQSQVVGRATLRNAFSWKQVAADAVSGVAGYGIQRGFGLDVKFDGLSIAADAFGNAIGNSYKATMDSRRAQAPMDFGPFTPDQSMDDGAGLGGLGSSMSSVMGGGEFLSGDPTGSNAWASSRSALGANGLGPSREDRIARLNRLFDRATRISNNVSDQELAQLETDYRQQLFGGPQANAPTLGTVEVLGPELAAKRQADWNAWIARTYSGLTVSSGRPMRASAGNQPLSEGEKIFLRTVGGVAGVVDSLAGAVKGGATLARNFAGAALLETGASDLLGMREDHQAYADQLGATVAGVVDFVTEDGRLAKLKEAFLGRYSEADALEANGDGWSVLNAARLRSSATFDIGSSVVGAGGVLKSTGSLALRAARGAAALEDVSLAGATVGNTQRAELIAEANSRSAYLRGKFGSLSSEQRLARIDDLSYANLTRRVDEMINSQDYVFRYLTDSGLQASLKYNSVRGYATTNFSSSSAEVMKGAQIFEQWPGAPFTGPVKYGVAIPVNRLKGFSVARPMGGAGTSGWEIFANSYPAAGAGGYSQFLINPVPLNQTYLFTLRP